MDWKLFWLILAMGIGLVILQGIASLADGYLTQAQMRSHGVINGWSFMEHGGMWADVFVISPIVAYAMSNTKLNYFSGWGLLILGISVGITLFMGYMYQRGGITTPEAHTHDGTTTIAGWIHIFFAVMAISTCGLVYLNLTTPLLSRFDIVVISLLLTPFFYLGITKFSERWTFSTAAKWQVAIEVIGLWVVTIIRLRYV